MRELNYYTHPMTDPDYYNRICTICERLKAKTATHQDHDYFAKYAHPDLKRTTYRFLANRAASYGNLNQTLYYGPHPLSAYAKRR